MVRDTRRGLLGGSIIESTGDVAAVYTGIGIITVVIPLVFAFGPIGQRGTLCSTGSGVRGGSPPRLSMIGNTSSHQSGLGCFLA